MSVPAGSALDVVARIVTKEFAIRLGEQVVVEDCPRGLGLIAAQTVANATSTDHGCLMAVTQVDVEKNPMADITCSERTSTHPDAQDAVWVANTTRDRLFYPYVSSCLSVTLVFQNGLLGGHASQVNTESEMRPAENLQALIGRMIAKAPSKPDDRGRLERIYFIGTAKTNEWEIEKAAKVIESQFGLPHTRREWDLSPVDIVFDTHNQMVYTASRKGTKSESAAKAVEDAKQINAEASYLKD